MTYMEPWEFAAGCVLAVAVLFTLVWLWSEAWRAFWNPRQRYYEDKE
jgi:protein-S-isoprenylcysteine O-methyltransferase Ste14